MRLTRLSRAADVEHLETRLLLNAPPEKFVVPIAGREGVDWAITSYVDQDPAPAVTSDYRGLQYAQDGSTATNFSLADFAGMDRGVDALAAAGGTVVEAHDGEFDRVISVDAPVQPRIPDNYVLIDHGGGWRTRYGRLREGSVTVSPGQVVAAGQKIGQVGGSGESCAWTYWELDTFMRFQVTHDGQVVDPFLDPDAFWQSPPAFAGDLVGVWYMTTLTARIQHEPREHLPRRHVFHPGETVLLNSPMHGLNAGRIHDNRWFQPDGTQFFQNPGPTPADRPWTQRIAQITLPADAPLGNWEVNMEVDGQELHRISFVVAPPSEGRPEIKVYLGSTYMIDGRTTAVSFGNVTQGATPLRRSFNIQNFGSQPLALGAVSLPPGFSVFGTPPTSVPANGSRALALQLDSQVAGAKGGRVTIHSDDADEGEFDFAVEGTVAGIPAAVEQVSVSGGAWSAAFREHMRSLDMGGDDGFDLSPSGPASRTLPWANVDRVSLRFNASVPVERGDLSVRGINVADHAISDFSYDAGRRTATWTLGRSLGNDRVTLTLDAAVLGTAWSSAVNVLPGDTDGSGVVLANDFSEVKRKFFATTTNPGAGDAAYSVFHDVDGSSSILANDFSAVKQRFFNRLPDAAPAPAAPMTGAVVRRATSVTAEVLRSEQGTV